MITSPEGEIKFVKVDRSGVNVYRRTDIKDVIIAELKERSYPTMDELLKAITHEERRNNHVKQRALTTSKDIVSTWPSSLGDN